MGLWELEGAGKCIYLVVCFRRGVVTGERRLVSYGFDQAALRHVDLGLAK